MCMHATKLTSLRGDVSSISMPSLKPGTVPAKEETGSLLLQQYSFRNYFTAVKLA
jgi:hypothetical protein